MAMNKRVSKLVADARQALTSDEEVLDATSGMIHVRRMGNNTERTGAVIVTNRRVVLFTKKLGGYDVQDFVYGLLSSVDHKKGVMFGNLNLAAAGDRSHVSMIPKEDVERISQLIREKMALAHSGGQMSTSPPAPPAEDMATTIRNLAGLRDEGSISPEDFEAKKKQILGL
jgi:hypothetical protein